MISNLELIFLQEYSSQQVELPFHSANIALMSQAKTITQKPKIGFNSHTSDAAYNINLVQPVYRSSQLSSALKTCENK